MRREEQFLGVDRSLQRGWVKGQAMDVSVGVATRPTDENRPPPPHHSPPGAYAADIVVTSAPRKVVTNAASTGIRIDRKSLKSLARRSDTPGLTYLAAWGVALGADRLPGLACIGDALRVAGDVRLRRGHVGPGLFAQPRDGARNGVPHPLAQRDRLLDHVAPLRRGAAASALHAHEPPHPHLVRRPRQPDALRHTARLQGLALRRQRPVAAQVPAPGPVAARDRSATRR